MSIKSLLGLKARPAVKNKPTTVVPLSHAGAMAYWASRRKGNENEPAGYAGADLTRTRFLEEKIKAHLPYNTRILEIGPNAGRNLAYLRDRGYQNLTGIEINPAAVAVMRETYPQLSDVSITVSPIEDAIKLVETNSFDLIFTMAVLEHIHFESDWMFAEMARIAPNIITIEDESSASERHFPRQYKSVFVGLGMKEVDFSDTVPGLPKMFRYRFFKRIS